MKAQEANCRGGAETHERRGGVTSPEPSVAMHILLLVLLPKVVVQYSDFGLHEAHWTTATLRRSD